MQGLTFQTDDEDHTIALGAALARLLRPGDVLALDGDLGAGKTRLVRGIAEGLNLETAQVASPTYVLVHEYLPRSSVGTPLYHVDAYRLSGPDDLEAMGWDRVMDGFGIVAIEWASRIAAALAEEPSMARVRIEAKGPQKRRIDLIAPAAWTTRPEWRSLTALAADGGDRSGWTTCPITGRPVAPGNPTFPFADEQAKMADLGKWMTGAYTLSRELTEDDESDPDLA